MDELKKKPWYQNALPSDQDDMQSFVKQLERVVREEEREMVEKEIEKRIDAWENSEDWDGTLNDGLYGLAYFVQSLNTPKHETN